MDEAGDKIHPHLAWVQEVGGRNRGRYYGLTGIIDKDKVDELAKSMPNSSGIKGHRQKFTQEQVQQMINQALQGLNETWERKFKSLEKSLRGVPPSGIDPEVSLLLNTIPVSFPGTMSCHVIKKKIVAVHPATNGRRLAERLLPAAARRPPPHATLDRS